MKKIYALGLIAGSLLLANCGVELGYPGGTGGASSGQTGSGLYIFVSASHKGGELGGTSGADSICNSDGNKPAGGGNYKALVYSSTRVPGGNDWPLLANKQYIRADKVIIGTTTSSRTFGTLGSKIDTTGSSSSVWTGYGSGFAAGGNCSDWSDTTQTGALGSSGNTNDAAFGSNNTQSCNTAFPIYCVQIN